VGEGVLVASTCFLDLAEYSGEGVEELGENLCGRPFGPCVNAAVEELGDRRGGVALVLEVVDGDLQRVPGAEVEDVEVGAARRLGDELEHRRALRAELAQLDGQLGGPRIELGERRLVHVAAPAAVPAGVVHLDDDLARPRSRRA